MSDVTRILSQVEQGDPAAAEQLLPLVYAELRKLAAARLARERPGQTLDATALVHETYLRLVGEGVGGQESEIGGSRAGNHSSTPDSRSPTPVWRSRGHFFAAAAEAMRRILIDLARKKASDRKGGGQQRCDLRDRDSLSLPIDDSLLDLDAALTRLEAADPAAAQTVKLRVFTGMTVEQVAEALNVSPRTAKRNWAYARAWLSRELAAYDQRDG